MLSLSSLGAPSRRLWERWQLFTPSHDVILNIQRVRVWFQLLLYCLRIALMSHGLIATLGWRQALIIGHIWCLHSVLFVLQVVVVNRVGDPMINVVFAIIS